MPSLRPFVSGIIDYAGLFPPAGLDMRDAVRCYAEYLKGRDHAMLGRFVLPAARLEEFSDAARGHLDRGRRSVPWCLAVLVDGEPSEARKAMLEFTASHTNESRNGHALCDAVEVPAESGGQITEVTTTFLPPLRVFFELAPKPAFERTIEMIGRTGAAAKIRTGGTTPEAFPSAQSIVAFVAACHKLGVPFKATAGLHHAFSGNYPVTNARNSAPGRMFGFVNLFLASAFIRNGMSEADARLVLDEGSADAFSFSDSGVSWGDNKVSRDDLRMTRSHLFLSFGSCSFQDPVDEARSFGLI